MYPFPLYENAAYPSRLLPGKEATCNHESVAGVYFQTSLKQLAIELPHPK